MRAFRLLPPLAVVVLGLTACTPIVGVEPAADAANPECASVMVSLPGVVAENELRETNSQATAAWGDPSQVVLRCGVTVPGPTTDPCASVNGIDWLIREEAEVWRATTYGRDPAVEVLFDPNQVPSSTILVDLASAVSVVDQDSPCLSVNDEVTLPEG